MQVPCTLCACSDETRKDETNRTCSQSSKLPSRQAVWHRLCSERPRSISSSTKLQSILCHSLHFPLSWLLYLLSLPLLASELAGRVSRLFQVSLFPPSPHPTPAPVNSFLCPLVHPWSIHHLWSMPMSWSSMLILVLHRGRRRLARI